MYPARYQLAELTAHLVALLERRRGAFETWSPETERALETEATAALADAQKAFAEVADDPQYWRRVEHTLRSVVLPRYLRIAGEEHQRELSGYGIWRKGDLVSRALYAGAGLLAALIIWRTPIPDWFEPIPLALFVVGPLIPDLQLSLAKRRYDKQLKQLVEDMRAEQSDAKLYQPLGVDEGATGASVEQPAAQNSTPTENRHKT